MFRFLWLSSSPSSQSKTLPLSSLKLAHLCWPLVWKVYKYYLVESSQQPFEGGIIIIPGLQMPKILRKVSVGTDLRKSVSKLTHALPKLLCFWCRADSRGFLTRALSPLHLQSCVCLPLTPFFPEPSQSISHQSSISQALLAVQGPSPSLVHSVSKYIWSTCCVPGVGDRGKQGLIFQPGRLPNYPLSLSSIQCLASS